MRAQSSGWHRAMVSIGQSVLAVVVAMLLVAGMVALLGRDPVLVIRALIEGPLDPRGYRFADAMGRACPLMLCGLAVGIAFRAQAWNIGVEGQYLCGAMACTAIGLGLDGLNGWALVPLMLIASAASGMLFAWPAIILENRRGVPLVLSTILLNFVAIGLVKYLTQGPLRGSDPSASQSDPIAQQAYLTALVPRTDLHWGFALAVLLAVVLWVILRNTTAGFAMTVAGHNPVAAQWSGLRVKQVKRNVMWLSGALGGLAGGIQIVGVHHVLNIQAAEGFGYVGIAVALLGQLHPIGIAVAAIGLGMLDVGASHLERQAQLGVPADLAQVIKGVLVLVILIVSGPRISKWLRRTSAQPPAPEGSTSSPPRPSNHVVADRRPNHNE